MLLSRIAGHQCLRHGDLRLGLLGERHADGVAQAVLQQGTDAGGALDASVLAVAGLGDAEVQRVIPAQLHHAVYQQAVGLHHHPGVAGLHAEHDVVEVFIAADAQKLECALHHAQRGVAVAVEDAVAEAAVVGAYAHGRAMVLADSHQRAETLVDALQLGPVLVVGVLAHVEFLLVGVVPGVHAYLLHNARGDLGGVRREVDVGHQRRAVAGGADALLDLGQVLGVRLVGRGDAHDLAARLDHADALCHGAGGVHGVRGGHALHPDGVVAPDAHGAHLHGAGAPALVVRKAWAVLIGLDHGVGRHGTAKVAGVACTL